MRSLLERRLIACGTIVPGARSLYRWKGKIADESEVMVYLKTRARARGSLEVAFGELHPYKVPELWRCRWPRGCEVPRVDQRPRPRWRSGDG